MNPQPANASRLAYIALGSNLGQSDAIVRAAMDRLQSLSDKPILRSSFWKTAPVDCPPGAPDFINAVVGFKPQVDETPESLLKKLLRMEQEFGERPRHIVNEPRPLDLDLIAFGTQSRNTPELTLPHPRTHLRSFVLAPLAELAPDLTLPGQTESVSRLLARLPAPQSAQTNDCNPTR